MSSLIIRLYDSAAQAAKAAQQLVDEGFEHVRHIKAGSGKNANRQALVTELMAAHIWKSHAETYADRLAKGGALVLVHAPFGSALNAEATLDQYEPNEKGITTQTWEPDAVWDDATPLSSALHLPVLINARLPAEILTGVSSLTKTTAFLSDFFGMPILKPGVHHATTSMGLGLLSKSATPLSSLFGLKTLSSNPTPLSSLLGLKVLSR
jgi:acetoin utilization deacetylase AcuC-like enzyme